METGAAVRVASGVTALGWRVWKVSESQDGLRLGSVIYDGLWLPGRAAIAACRRQEAPFADPVDPHDVPGTVCGCGIHAARDPVDAFSYLRGRDEPGTVARVLGEVVLSGQVVETEAGWRASVAWPARLYVDDPAIADALAIYGVPVLSPACASPSFRTCTATRSPSARRWRTSSAMTST
jgi:hypothetical protein